MRLRAIITLGCAAVTIPLSALAAPLAPAEGKAPLPAVFTCTPEEVAAAVALGQKMANEHKSRPDLLKPFTRPLKWTRGDSGANTDGSSVEFCSYRAHGFTVASYDAAVNYSKLNADASFFTTGARTVHPTFAVLLASGVSIGRHHLSYADRNDVTALKFVLTDDKGDVLVATPQSLQGRDISSKMITGGRPGSHQRKQSYDLFIEQYDATFDLLGTDGASLVSPLATKFVFHVVLPNGEQSVEYKVSDLN